MRKILLSSLFAIGLGIAAVPASAAPMSSLGPSPSALSLLQDAQLIVVGRGRRHCRSVRVCHRGYHGRPRCHYERVCRR
ncbi:MAG TPA: hypothetical protein VFC54_00135 [Pseudolabrys sp.]|nr:hypothetical protein [Pseudolabrys sp.]